MEVSARVDTIERKYNAHTCSLDYTKLIACFLFWAVTFNGGDAWHGMAWHEQA